MAWTSPRSWSDSEVVTSALLNTHLRDNLLMTAPAVMSAQGDIVIASGANTPIRLAKSTTSTQYLANTGTSNAPAWNEVALTTGVSGVLPVANGGLNASSLADKSVLITQDSGTDTVSAVAMDASGELLIGGTSGPAVATLTAGTNMTVTNGDGTITLSSTAGVEGSQTTEATTTSTSAADLISVTSISITAAAPFEFVVACRKTAGAGGDATCGLKLNATVVGEAITNEYADTTQTSVWSSRNPSSANSGQNYTTIGPRVANYLRAGTGIFTSIDTTNTLEIHNTTIPCKTADMPTATITSVIIRGHTASGSNTLGADELYVYERPTS